MRFFVLIVFVLTFFFVPHRLSAAMDSPPAINNPPVSTGTLFGNRGMYFQMLVNKKLQSAPRIGFFSVTSLVGEWDRQEISDLMTQGSVTFSLTSRLDFAAGFHVTPFTGFKPSAGLIYSYADPTWLLVINPRADLTNNGSIEGFTLLEYKPLISESWRFFSRLQVLYGFNPRSGDHARSYLVARAGLNYREFTFGVGANIDYYGPVRRNENNIGVFLSVQLF